MTQSPAPAGGAPRFDGLGQATGELHVAELAYRLGLLVGAALFLVEAVGLPWSRGPLVMLGGLAMSALIITTMALQWRVLGDWRRRTQQGLLLATVAILTIPLCAVLLPRLGSSALPASVEAALSGVLTTLTRLPGAGPVFELLRGLVILLLYSVVMIVLIFSSGADKRAGFTIIGLGVVAVLLFFYPTAETVIGLIFLGLFFRSQWERAVMIPDRLRPHLSPLQLAYLRDLVEQGALSTGETKVYLEQDARAFAELLEYHLVEYDSIAREVLPGKRLLHDPACETLDRMLGFSRRAIWMVVGIVYFLMPNFIPGMVDDFIVLAICSGASLNLFGPLFASRVRRGFRR
ncbi:MAG: hypothetical protein KF858_04300 [Candidatus Sumerlaeia bacterium]|nr:hypothetical protein [Candidatus Sumerlaeia bacterium]